MLVPLGFLLQITDKMDRNENTLFLNMFENKDERVII